MATVLQAQPRAFLDGKRPWLALYNVRLRTYTSEPEKEVSCLRRLAEHGLEQGMRPQRASGARGGGGGVFPPAPAVVVLTLPPPPGRAEPHPEAAARGAAARCLRQATGREPGRGAGRLPAVAPSGRDAHPLEGGLPGGLLRQRCRGQLCPGEAALPGQLEDDATGPAAPSLW